MYKRTLEIRDKVGTTFKMKVSLPSNRFMVIRVMKDMKNLLTSGGWFGGVIWGDWSTVDEGFILHRSGKTRTRFSETGDLTTSDLLILGPGGIKAFDSGDRFGMMLFEFDDILGPNSSGEGFVIQPWVINLTPGRIFWKSV